MLGLHLRLSDVPLKNEPRLPFWQQKGDVVLRSHLLLKYDGFVNELLQGEGKPNGMVVFRNRGPSG
jgi:hypothetical protein